MRVKILQGRAGVDVSYDAGEEYDLPDGRAARWIDAGFAEAVGPVVEIEPVVEPVVETAVVPAAEIPEIVPVVEVAVRPAAPEVATKGRGRRK